MSHQKRKPPEPPIFSPTVLPYVPLATTSSVFCMPFSQYPWSQHHTNKPRHYIIIHLTIHLHSFKRHHRQSNKIKWAIFFFPSKTTPSIQPQWAHTHNSPFSPAEPLYLQCLLKIKVIILSLIFPFFSLWLIVHIHCSKLEKCRDLIL